MPEDKLLAKREEVPDKDKWDLTPLFKDDSQWENSFNLLEEEIEAYKDFKGTLESSLEQFIKAIEFDLYISRKIERVYTYAHLKSDEDKTNQHYQGISQRALTLANRISELSSFLTPEIQGLPGERIKEYIKDDRLKEYSFFLEQILRFKPHTLNQEIEEILAMSGEIAHAPSQFFSQLDNADLTFGTIEDDSGKKVELTHGNFSTFLISKNRELREKAFFQYYKSYEDHKHSISSSLASSNKKDYFYSRVRKFDSCRKASLFSDNVSEDVYDNLIAAVRRNLPSLFKYLDFRRKALGIKELHFYDTYVPIIGDIDFRMTFDEAVDVCGKALAPLGREYVDNLMMGLKGGWVDRYENRGKRSGAYSSGCYDSPPYILMNYEEKNINSLYTLIHEAGHSMHSFYSKKNQPYVYHDYTIFVAEVASTFNEVLLSRYLIDLYSNDSKMQAFILNREIDNIRGTLFRQTMFAEFEKNTHEMLEERKPLTFDVLSESYGKLLKAYFGDMMIIDEVLKLECLRIPHFYSPFYVYKYATGISAAISLAQGVIEKGEPAKEDYLKFLKMGGSKFPLDELKDAGVDMRQPEPVENAIKYFEGLIRKLIDIMS